MDAGAPFVVAGAWMFIGCSLGDIYRLYIYIYIFIFICSVYIYITLFSFIKNSIYIYNLYM